MIQATSLATWVVAGSLITAAFQTAAPSPYLGQPVPGLTPALFAPGIVSTGAIELNGVFAPDLSEFFFARNIDGTPALFHSVRTKGTWSAPRPLMLYPGQAHALAVDMAVSPDGNELFFLGRYHPPAASGSERTDTDIWRSRRVNGAWTTAKLVPAPVSTEASEVYPTIVADGSLYFTSNRPGGPGRSNLNRASGSPTGTSPSPFSCRLRSRASSASGIRSCPQTRSTWYSRHGGRRTSAPAISSRRFDAQMVDGRSQYTSGRR